MTWAPSQSADRPLQPAGLLIGTGLLGLALLMGMPQSPGWGSPMMDAGTAGMMGTLTLATAARTPPLPDTELRRRLEAFAASRWPASTLNDLMPFADNTYAVVTDPASGQGLVEVLVDRYTGAVKPEPGPNMVWNTRSSMPGRWIGAPALTPTSEADARTLATTFLSTYLPGAVVSEARVLPGYFTFDYRQGDAEGMLSVNAHTGEIWRHTWHGPSRMAEAGS